MICALCPAATIQAKDGLCRVCRLRSFQVVKYSWTPEKDAELTRAYRGAKNKRELSARLSSLANRYRWPRFALLNRATTLGLRKVCVQRPWTQKEIDYLRDQATMRSIKEMAWELDRSQASVKNKLFLLDLSAQVLEGYTQNELAKLFGVHHNKIGLWIGRGWLRLDLAEVRVTQESVEDFVWRHMDEYRFASCEEWWLKTLLKPRIGYPVEHGAETRRKEAA